MKALLQGHSGTAPEKSRNTYGTNLGTTEDDFQSDTHPEAGIFHNQTTGNSDAGDDHDMVTGVHEEVTYCSPSTSSEKQKKKRPTSQPHVCSENTAATIEAKQILLGFQQLQINCTSANFYNNINRISNLPKLLTTTIPTFDGISEKFELFEDLFQTSLKIHDQLTEDDRINYFHSPMRGDALQTSKKNNCPTQENLREILAVFRRRYVKHQSMATKPGEISK